MMNHIKKKAVKTQLFQSQTPLEWAITANNTLYNTHIPIDDKGQVVSGEIEKQTQQVFNNLVHTLEAANITTDDVLQVLIYVTDKSYLATVNKIYGSYFNAPYPSGSRGC